MPYSRRSYHRRRPTYRHRRRSNRLNRFNKLSSMSRFRASQNQTYKTFWFAESGRIVATTGNGEIFRQFNVRSLLLISQFTSACYIFEQYRVMKIILTCFPIANDSTGVINRYHRGTCVSWVDAPPFVLPPQTPRPVNIEGVINNASARVHNSRSRIKRYIYRPRDQYNNWAYIGRDMTTNPPTPQPVTDEWQTRLMLFGEDFNQPYVEIPPVGPPETHPVPDNIDNTYYYYTLKFLVQFKCRVDM